MKNQMINEQLEVSHWRNNKEKVITKNSDKTSVNKNDVDYNNNNPRNNTKRCVMDDKTNSGCENFNRL